MAASTKLEILNHPEAAVRDRYAAAAQAAEAALCCPVQYNADYLAMLPAEVVE